MSEQRSWYRSPDPDSSGNGRSWRWTRRAKNLATVLALVLIAVALFVAAIYGLHKQDQWRCQHGTPAACDTSHDPRN